MPAGRKPTSAEERRARGETHRPMPVVVGGRERPDPPPFLTNNMLEAWDYIIEDLLKADMLDHADGGILEAAAVFWGTARDARMVRTMEMSKRGGGNGLTERTPQGRVENRLLAIERNSWKEFRALADVLPLSPWGRARLGMKMRGAGQTIEDDIGAPPRLRAVAGGAPEDD